MRSNFSPIRWKAHRFSTCNFKLKLFKFWCRIGILRKPKRSKDRDDSRWQGFIYRRGVHVGTMPKSTTLVPHGYYRQKTWTVRPVDHYRRLKVGFMFKDLDWTASKLVWAGSEIEWKVELNKLRLLKELGAFYWNIAGNYFLLRGRDKHVGCVFADIWYWDHIFYHWRIVKCSQTRW